MKIKRQIFTVLFAMGISVSSFGANVAWNTVKTVYMDLVGDGNVYQTFDTSISVVFSALVSPANDGWQPAKGVSSICDVWIREMRPGDVVSGETMLAEGLDYFYVAKQGMGNPQSDYDLIFEDEPKYLAFASPTGGAQNPYMAYGWIEVDSDFNVLASAIELDGGDIVVGGGAIPEPTSTLLLLLGISGLALRRKIK